jgi:hypothetical protein
MTVANPSDEGHLEVIHVSEHSYLGHFPILP